MKFGKQLAAQQIPAWAPSYIDYKGLKKIINSLAKGRPADAALLAAGFRPPFNLPDTPAATELSAAANLGNEQPHLLPDSGESALLQAHKAAFFFKLERELEKINAFYLQKEAEMKSRMRALIDKRKVIQAHLAGTLSRDSAAFIALYDGLRYFERDLSKLQNYIEMNATGFRKILKKWDKRSKSTTKELYLARQVDVQPCFNREVISELSDTAAANVRKLEGLCIAKGGETTVDPAADGILSERKAELAAANAEARGEFLSNLENELMAAVRSGDKESVDNIIANLPASEHLENQLAHQLARIFWRAAISQPTEKSNLIEAAHLDFTFVDDISGRTALIEAAVQGRSHLVMLCVQKGVDVRHRDAYNREAIHYAAMVDAQICEYLLQHGADPNPVDFDGSSPLIYAISARKLECVAVLLAHATSTTRSQESILPIALAARQGVVSIVSLLLENGHPIAPDASGYLPQHIAAKEGHVEVLDVLLRAGAALDAPDKFANWTPLFHAANEGHLDCVKALLRAGASVAAVDEQGKTAIHHAAWSGHPEVVSALLLASPRSNLRPVNNLSPSDSNRKRDATTMDEMDLDPDLIPDLSLPPPALPLRTYGHNYLDNKRSLVQLSLGFPTTSPTPIAPVRFYRADQLASVKLVITSLQDSFNAPHTVTLPQSDNFEPISLLVDSLQDLTLSIEVFPTFGSRMIGKAVCLPSTFSQLRSIDRYSAPILDTHLSIVGEVNFEMSRVSHFENVQLAIGGRLETYWKSTTTEPATKPSSWKAGSTPETSYITASSLKGDYAKVVVQVTRDGVPFVYPRWYLPTDLVNLGVMDVTAAQLLKIASQQGMDLSSKPLPQQSEDAKVWHDAVASVVCPLQEVFSALDGDVGLNLEIRYPTPSDCARLGIRDPIEVNTYIDAVLKVVYANTLSTTGTARRILFSSFAPAACAALNWKQPNYAVLFASYCGLSRSTPEGQLNPPNRTELDRRCTSIEGAYKFAKGNNLLGLLLDATIVTQVPSLVDSIKESGLLLALFGSSAKALPHVDAYAQRDGVLTAGSPMNGSL